MPWTPGKKSTVSTWFNRVIGETLERETVPEETVTVQQQVKTATREYRAPECIEYQSVQNTKVYRVPGCTDY